MTNAYRVEVTRDDQWWLIRVEGIEGLSQARRRSDVEGNAKELIAAATGQKLERIGVTVIPKREDGDRRNEPI